MDIRLQVHASVRAYGDALRAAAEDALIEIGDELLAELQEQAPAPGNRNRHPYSRGVTQLGWRLSPVSKTRLRFANRRTRGMDPGDRPPRAGDGEDVSGYINEGYTRHGARTAESFRARGITDAYHLYSLREAEPRLRTTYKRVVAQQIGRR